MARPLHITYCVFCIPYSVFRIEFDDALYHVTARDNARANIDGHDDDRQRFLSLLKTVVDRYDWYCHAYRGMLSNFAKTVERVDIALKTLVHYFAVMPNLIRHPCVGHQSD